MTLIWTIVWLISSRPEIDFNGTGDPKQWATWLLIAVGLDLVGGTAS